MTIVRRQTTAPRSASRGFTLVELLLVITIITIVLSLILVSLSQLQNRARATACLSNQRQLALANMSYANDNDGRLVSPRTDSLPPPAPPGGLPPGVAIRGTPNCWVNTGTSGGLSDGVETVKSLQAGALWSYVGQNEKTYLSPMDPTGRVRSYSFSSFIGVGDNVEVLRADDYFDFPDFTDDATLPPYLNTQFKTVTLAQIPQPARTLTTITEHDRFQFVKYNLHGFAVQVGPPFGASGVWIDTPALWNTGRVNISYMDGSYDAPNIIYEELAQLIENDPDGHDVTEIGARPAFRFMTTILLPGIIRPELQ